MESDILATDSVKTESENERTTCMIFAKRLATCRKKAKMTQKALADAAGVSKVSIEKWEYGKRKPGLHNVVQIALVLKVPTDYLLGVSDYDGTMQTMGINERARNILIKAREKGEEHAFLFEMAFQLYIENLSMLDQLHDSISKHGAVITRVNVKGGKNLIAHPALKAYKSLATLTNDTEKLLISMYENPLGDSYRPDAFDLF